MTSLSDRPTRGLAIGRIAGVPVFLGRSWFLVAVVIVALFGPLLQRNNPGLGAGAYLVAGGFVALLLVSVLAHEAAHAVAAQASGYRVNRIVADFWGGHTAYDAAGSRAGPSALVAVAGPAANAVLAGLGYLALAVLDLLPGGVPVLLLTAFTWANAIVAVFNLLPGLPLDGGFLVEAAVWRATGSRSRGTIVAGWFGRVVVLGVVLALVVMPLINGGGLDPLRIALVAAFGAFLWFGASDAVRTGRSRHRLERARVAGLLRPVSIASLDSQVAGLVGADPTHAVVVLDETGVPIGLLDPGALARVAPMERAGTPVSALTRRFPPSWVVPADPDDSAALAVAALAEARTAAIVVVDEHGRPRGLIRAHDVADLLRH